MAKSKKDLKRLDNEVFGNGKEGLRMIATRHGAYLKVLITLNILIFLSVIGMYLK